MGQLFCYAHPVAMIRIPGRTIQVQRLLMAALQPLTGVRATATALVKSSGSEPVEIPANFYAYPLPESETGQKSVDDQRLIRTAEQLVATPEGTEVPVTSLLGGEWYNSLRAGTELMWSPPVIGLETHSRLTTDMTGGVNPPEVNGELYPGFVRNIHTFDELAVGGPDAEQRLFEAMVAAAPVIVISWERSSTGVLRGRQTSERPDVWLLHAISENRGGQVPRRHQAMHILDRIEELLTDVGDVDGAPFSSPPAVIQQRRRGSSNTQVITRALQLATYRTVKAIDRADSPPGMTPQDVPGADWERTSYRLHTTDEPPKDVVRGVVDEMPGGAFSDDFSDDFDT